MTTELPAGATIVGCGCATTGLILKVHTVQPLFGAELLKGPFNVVVLDLLAVKKHIGDKMCHNAFVSLMKYLSSSRQQTFEDIEALLYASSVNEETAIETYRLLVGRKQWMLDTGINPLLMWHYNQFIRQYQEIDPYYLKAIPPTIPPSPVQLQPLPLERSQRVTPTSANSPHPATGFPVPFRRLQVGSMYDPRGDKGLVDEVCSFEELFRLQTMIDTKCAIEFDRVPDKDAIVEFILTKSRLPGVVENHYHPYAQDLINQDWQNMVGHHF